MKDIFLSYSRKDKKQASRLKSELENLGYTIWFDEDDILPGQSWELSVKKSIRDSQVVIIGISTNWVNDKSYVHKEVKIALEVMDQLPESQVFIIPVKLDKCPIPDKLERFHYIEMYKSGYLVKLQKVLGTVIHKKDDENEKKNLRS
jgi:TIR domain